MPDGTFVKALEELARKAQAPEILEVDGVKYVSKKVIDPREPDPQAHALTVHTLSALVEYIRSNKDGLLVTEHLIHVVGATSVDIVSTLKGRFRQREKVLTSVFPPPFDEHGREGFRLGEYLSAEWFVIGLMTHFEKTEDRDKAISLIGNMREEAVRTVEDDGHTQAISARKGVSLRHNVSLPNPIMLAARRSFPEIEQPVSPFVLRVRGGGEEKLPEVALFEADGGAWELESVERIAEFLSSNLPDGWVVLA